MVIKPVIVVGKLAGVTSLLAFRRSTAIINDEIYLVLSVAPMRGCFTGNKIDVDLLESSLSFVATPVDIIVFCWSGLATRGSRLILRVRGIQVSDERLFALVLRVVITAAEVTLFEYHTALVFMNRLFYHSADFRVDSVNSIDLSLSPFYMHRVITILDLIT